MGINSIGLNKSLLRAALVAGLAWASNSSFHSLHAQAIWEAGPATVKRSSELVPPSSPYGTQTYSPLPTAQLPGGQTSREIRQTPAIQPSPVREPVVAAPLGSSTSPKTMQPNSTLPAPVLNGAFPTNSATRITPAPQQHLPSGPLRSIDISKLPPDVLNCDVCRSRLGLPPLVKSNSTPQPATSSSNFFDVSEAKPMLGSPGLLSAGTGKRLEESGMVIEEFRPPQPKPEDFQLDNLPPEARQQFYQGLDLPRGARVMSAQLLDGKSSSLDGTPSTTGSPSTTSSPITSSNTPSSVLGGSLPNLDIPAADSAVPRSLGAPGIAPAPSVPLIPPRAVPAIPVPPTPKSIEANAELPTLSEALSTPRLPTPSQLGLQDSVSDSEEIAVASPANNVRPSRTETIESKQRPDDSSRAKPTASAPAESKPNQESSAASLAKQDSELQNVIKDLREQNTKLNLEIAELKKTHQAREAEWMKMLESNNQSVEEQKTILNQQRELEAKVRAQTEVFESKLMELEKQNRTTSKMLEARTAEVTELQNKLKAAELRARREGGNKEGAKPKSKPKNGDSAESNE